MNGFAPHESHPCPKLIDCKEDAEHPAAAAESGSRRVGSPGYGPPGREREGGAPPVALILDTGPLYASLDRDGADHVRSRRLIEEATELLVVPAPVLTEVDYWIHVRLHPGVLVALLDDIVERKLATLRGLGRFQNVPATGKMEEDP